jgi:hypothetical protein
VRDSKLPRRGSSGGYPYLLPPEVLHRVEPG